MHGKCWIDRVIDLTAVRTDARQQDERRQGLPATSIDLIRSPFGQNEAVASRIDEIEQGRLSSNGHIRLERCISRTTRKHDDGTEPSERGIGAVVLVRRDHGGRRGKPGGSQSSGQRCCAGGTIIGDDQDVFRANTGRVVAHARSANDTASAAIVGIGEGIEFATIGRIAIAIGITRIAARQCAHTANTCAHAVGRIGTHHAAHAAIGFVRFERRFTAVGDHHVAIVESRLTGSDHAHAHVASTRPIGDSGTRHSAATAMPHVRFRIGFAAIDGATEAISKSGHTAANAACIPSASRKPIGNGRTDVSTSSAMRDRIGQIGFATIGDDAVAIVITGITAANHARRAFAFRITMRDGAANLAAHAAIEDVRRELRFATAPNAIVAIIEARGTSSDGAHAIGTSRSRIGRRWTRRPASAAIERIRARVDFATVRLQAVAIGKSGQTFAENACTSDASGFGISRRHALIAATTAMVCVIAQVDFTTVRNLAIAISKPLFAIADGAHRVLAAAKCIRGFAFGSASAAIFSTVAQFDFTTVQKGVVAVRESSIAGYSAASSNTRRAAIDAERTRLVASTAIVDIGGNVRTSIEATRLAGGTRSTRPARLGIDIGASIGRFVGTILIAEAIRSIFARCCTSSEQRCARKGDQ